MSNLVMITILIHFFPLFNAFQHYAQKTSTREGCLLGFVKQPGGKFTKQVEISSPGVLDIVTHSDWSSFITCQSDGSVQLWSISHSPTELALKKVCEHQLTESILLNGAINDLSVRCPHERRPTSSYIHRTAVSDSDGNVHILHNSLMSLGSISFRAHQYSTWCVEWVREHRDLLLTGGDDQKMCLWDLRSSISLIGKGSKRRRMQNSKPVLTFNHDAGVCSIQSMYNRENIVSSGCYDESLRLWDIRMPDCPNRRLTSHSFKGGVWKHQWLHDIKSDYVLVAAMHAGFAVGRLSSKDNTMETVATFRSSECSKSLAYGIDWQLCNDYQGSSFRAKIASCSFYDNRLDFSYLTVPSKAR